VTTLAASPSRRLTQRLPRLDTRLVVGLVLVGLSVIGGLRLAAGADHSVVVYTAARSLPADHVLVPGDIGTTRIQATDAVLDRLVRATTARPPTDRVLRYPLAEGDLVANAALGQVAREGREITVPIAPEHALGGAVEPGDRVDVLGSFDKGTEEAKTLTVAAGAQVVDVVHTDGLFGQHEGALAALTISVAPRDVVFVAFAVRNGELDIVRSVGKRPRAVRSRFDAGDLP
jgi:Flp pilus assembly protein CpaB